MMDDHSINQSGWNIAISAWAADMQELGLAGTAPQAGLCDGKRSWENGDFTIVRDHDADGS